MIRTRYLHYPIVYRIPGQSFRKSRATIPHPLEEIARRLGTVADRYVQIMRHPVSRLLTHIYVHTSYVLSLAIRASYVLCSISENYVNTFPSFVALHRGDGTEVTKLYAAPSRLVLSLVSSDRAAFLRE